MYSLGVFRTPPHLFPSSPRRGISLIEVLVVLGVIGLLAALFLPATRSVRGAARRTQCKNNLKQIALALHRYADEYGALPPAHTVDAQGRPLHSWRTLILPFLDQKALYETIDLSKPWDDPVNAEARETVLPVYVCPNSIAAPKTPYLALVGENSCFHPTLPRKFDEITDPKSATLMIIEANDKLAVPWMAPVDADEALFQSMNKNSGLPHEEGLQAALVDGTVRYLSGDTSPEVRRALTTISGNEPAGDF